MAKWDHADLLNVDTKAVLYPEYCDLENLKRYNPGYLLTEEGRKRFPDNIPVVNVDTTAPSFVTRTLSPFEQTKKSGIDDLSTWPGTSLSGSKDPSTKCGCVIVRPNKTVASLGYNGFPRGIPDKEEWLNNREEKYKRVIHGEMNAILNAREPLHGYTLYTYPGPCSCNICTIHIIQAGITRIVAPLADQIHAERWAESIAVSKELYAEAGVEVTIYD